MTHLNAAKWCECSVCVCDDLVWDREWLIPFSPYFKNKKLIFDLFLVVVSDSVFDL